MLETNKFFDTKKLVRVTGVISLLLGFVVIIGWYSKNVSLTQILPSFAPMQYNTALGFLLSGVGILSLFSISKILLTSGSLIFLLGSLTIIQYIFGVNFGIDQFFIENHITTKTSHPGRMAPNTALCFSLTGAALLISFFVKEKTSKYFILLITSSFILILSLVAFAGYVYELEAAYGWANLTRMALHTSIGFIIVSFGIILHTFSFTPNSSEKQLFFIWPSMLAGLTFMIFSFILWVEVDNHERALIRDNIKEENSKIKQSLIDNINSSVIALERMAQRWENSVGTEKSQWRADAKNYIEDNAGLTTIEWVDETYHVRWVEPVDGNEKAIGLNIAFNKKREMALKGASEKDIITITPPLDLVQGFRAIIAYVPIHIDRKFDGFIVAIYDLNILLEKTLSQLLGSSLNLYITDENEKVFTLGDQNNRYRDFSASSKIQLFNRTWSLTLVPNASYLNNKRSALPDIILLAGALLAIFLSSAIYYAFNANYRRKLLAKKTTELEESEAFLELIMQNNPDLIFVKNKEFKIIQANEAFLNVYPKEVRDKVIGYTTIEGGNKKERENFLKMDKVAFKKGYSETTEKITFPNKKVKTLYTHKIRFKNLEDEEFILGISRDVTEREELIDRLTDSNEELERFAYVCSHDLQEPLRMIRIFSERLGQHMSEKIKDDDKGKKYLNFVTDNASRAQDLIADILTYSSIDSDTQKLVKVDMNELVTSVKYNLFANLEENQGTITSDNLPTVKGNKTQLYQILQNLINNGIKYQKEETKPKVHVGVKDIKTHWQFSVKDNGIGIEERHLNKIFEVFKRLHGKTEYSGTGVGLSICKKIAERHSGRIWVESEVGEGSTFFFTIGK